MADETEIQAVWEKGYEILGLDPKVWQKDSMGNKIKRDEHGKTTKHGWEIDHIEPTSKGGADTLENKQPLQWEENRRKSSKPFSYKDAIL